MNYNAFEGIEILYGTKGYSKIKNSHFMVIGIGGVGSWICESLARSGVKEITIIDLDDICVTNVNRQVHATYNSIGKFKVDIMKERMLEINPNIVVHSIQDNFTSKSSQKILATNTDYIFDAIDSVNPKSFLLDQCRKINKKVITIGAAGGLKDPTKISVTDLNKTTHDRMLHRVRRILKKEYNFPKYSNKKFHIPAVYSTEEIDFNKQKNILGAQHKFNCNNGLGSISFVTASFGFIALSFVFQELIENICD